eukprot:g12478.t1
MQVVPDTSHPRYSSVLPVALCEASASRDGSAQANDEEGEALRGPKRCVDLGFGLANALEPEVVTGAMEKFQPELTVLVPDLEELPEAFSASTGRCYVVKVGLQMPGAPWPEFAPIWFQKDPSFTGPNGSNVGSEVGAELVPVGKEETALSLRGLDEKKERLRTIYRPKLQRCRPSGALPKLEKVDDTQEQAPKQINLKWDEEGAVCLGWAVRWVYGDMHSTWSGALMTWQTRQKC